MLTDPPGNSVNKTLAVDVDGVAPPLGGPRQQPTVGNTPKLLKQSALITSQEGSQEMSLLLSAKALAGLLGVSERMVWKLVAKGDLWPPFRLGRLARWHRQEVVAWIGCGCPKRNTPFPQVGNGYYPAAVRSRGQRGQNL